MRLLTLAAASLAAMSVAACGGSSSPLQAQDHPEIVNQADSFSFQLTGVTNGGGTLSYAWQNSGTMASIDRSSSVAAGTVTLTVLDAAQAQVYSGPLNGTTGSVATAAGTPGNWTIQLDFVDTTGTINFRAQKK